MNAYRWPVVAALISLGGGFIYQRIHGRVHAKTSDWVGVAAERRGTGEARSGASAHLQR